MDVELDLDDNRLNDYIHILAKEQKSKDMPVLSGDIVLERTRYLSGTADYLSYEFDIDGLSEDDYQAKAVLNAIAREQHKTGILLDEQYINYFDRSSGNDHITYFRLILSCCSDAELASLKDFLKTMSVSEKIYEVEFNQENHHYNFVTASDGQTFYPLYELEDICIKSKNRVSNNRLWNFDDAYPQKTEDMYVPSTAQTIAFAQVGKNAYLLTNRTTDRCEWLRSSLNDELAHDEYTMQLCCGHLPTYLYPSLAELSAIYPAESYRKALNVYQTQDASDLFGSRTSNNFFRPRVNLGGVQYNYVMQTPVSNIKTEYRNGNIYCDVYNTKNMYNAEYVMDMDSNASLRNCRDYTGIFECGGQIYLKYIDNVNYDATYIPDGEISSLGKTTTISVKESSGGYSYPKIETFNPITTGVSNKHKSYFFSVNLVDMAELETRQTDNLSVATYKEKLKFDITSSIKEIVKNVCPANTQLFDVYFGHNI